MYHLIQMCCECCVLGLLAQKESHECLLRISVSVSCQSVARVCCEGRQHSPLTLGIQGSSVLNEFYLFLTPAHAGEMLKQDITQQPITFTYSDILDCSLLAYRRVVIDLRQLWSVRIDYIYSNMQ